MPSTHAEDVATTAAAAALKASEVAAKAALDASMAAARAAELKAKTSWQVVAQLVVWLVMALLAYGSINTRLQVLEVRYDRVSQDVIEIKGDVKQLLRRQ